MKPSKQHGEVMSTPRIKYLLQLESIVFINDTTFDYSILNKVVPSGTNH